MNYDDEEIYVEFQISGIFKTKVKNKKIKMAKIQKIINSIINDETIHLIKSDSSLVSYTEAEIMNAFVNYTDEEF